MNSKNIKYLVIVSLVTVAGLLLFYFFSSQQFKLVSTSPSDESRGVDYNQPIELTFNKDLDATNIGVFNSRPHINAEVIVNGRTIYLQPTHALLEETAYEVIFPRITSVEGDSLDNTVLTFTTAIDNSPRAQFIRSLPIYRNGYNITYTKKTDLFVIQITNEPRNRYIDEAREHLDSRGINDDNDNIKIEILRSLDGGGSPPG